MHRLLAALLLLAALAGGAVAQGGAAGAMQATSQGRRVALVIGNGAYRNVPALSNAPADAHLVAEALRAQGFDLVGGDVQQDLDRTRFGQVVQAFGRALAGAEIGLFYYAGHGLQVQGVNWLVPVDANPGRPQDLDFQMLDADLVLRQMEGSGTRLNLMLLDACRNNPFLRTGIRATGSGLAEMRAPEGTLISYATQPGAVATDGPEGGNGPYATALADAIRQPDGDIFRLFNQVGLQVKRATQGAQQPWVSNSPIEGDLRIGRTTTSPIPVVPALVQPPQRPIPSPPDPLRTTLGALPCSLLDLQESPGGTRVAGLSPPGTDLPALRRLVATRGIRTVEGEVWPVPAFACPVLDLLAPAAASSPALLPGPVHRVLQAGQRATTEIKTSLPVLRIDLFEGDTVHHVGAILPPERLARPGPRLLTVIATRTPLPLDEPRRLASEPAEPYLRTLRTALQTAGPVEVGLAILDVRARPPAAISAAAPRPTAPSSRCAAMLERAQLGEPLNDSDRAMLRTCR